MKGDNQRVNAFGGRVACVTGAASGIGRAMVELMVEAGARVYAVDVDAAAIEQLRTEVAGRVTLCVLDVTDAAAYGNLVEDMIAREGRIDFLFNNAGVTLLGEAHRLPFERWKWLLDINLLGVIHGIAHIYPRMVAQGSGHIVNISSIAGGTGYASAAAYTMSKGAILGLSRSLRAEAKAHGVKVSVACPGYVRSNIFRAERVVGADVNQVLADLPVAMMSPRQAGSCILDGVAAGRHTIIFPLTAKILWLLGCWVPSSITPIHRRLMRVFAAKA